MQQYDNDNKGALWPAKERASDKHPHFTGRAMVGGVEYYVSGWKRDPNGNPKAPSVKFSFKAVDEVKQQAHQPQPQTQQQYQPQTTPQQYAQATGGQAPPANEVPDFHDDIPF
tara:strand:+ start:700 stop:1038 length:339 start_codon:yes stop_codon:yes gene_type:complete